MKKIYSIHNEEIKQLVKLHEARERLRQGLFLAEGLRIYKTFHQAGMRAKKTYVTSQMLSELVEFALPEYSIIEVSDLVMKKISPSICPSGLLGVYEIPANPSLSLVSDGIVLVNITDPGNMGTLIRSCAAFGKKSVVIVDGVDPYNPKVVQASAGTIAHVHLLRTTLEELIALKDRIILQALVVEGGMPTIARHQKPTLLVVGNEAHGLSAQWRAACHELISLPMPGNIESLNAAVAGSIAMYVSWIKK